MSAASAPALRVFSTCPQSRDVERSVYPGRIADVARWSEAAGCEGILVYTDNGILDPWLVSQLIIQATERLCPLVAVQSVYMHPFTVAKMVSSLAHLHGRRMYLNMVAGGFRNDLTALGDETPHDDRYERVIEYTGIVKALLAGGEPVSHSGRYYRVRNLRLTPAISSELMPGFTLSGSSAAGLAAARALGAIAVKYPQRADEQEPQVAPGVEAGMRVGIIARETSEEAWGVAHERFPSDRRGQLAHQLAMRVSDSHWHRQLSASPDQPSGEDPYWLGPFQNYHSFCPYLVGDHRRLAAEIARYMRLGFSTFVLDVPPTEEELHHIGVVFRAAMATAER